MDRIHKNTKKTDKKKDSKRHDKLQSKEVKLKVLKEFYERFKNQKKMQPKIKEKQVVPLCQQTDTNQHNLKTPRVKLRSSSEKCTKDDVKKMLKKYNFFDFFRNETGNFTNDFEVKTISSNKVVIDHATGLMWHQSGSITQMDWVKEYEWKKILNHKEYAGYSDWRLPTIEEAASLLKPENKKTDLYIHHFFDKQQLSIWTCDRNCSNGVWYVDFLNGYIQNFSYYTYYSRPVRSCK